MFDRTYVENNRTEYKPYEKTVREIKAPTDDSVRLYQEILEKAYDSVLGSIQVNNNEFSYKVLFCEDPIKLQLKGMLRATLNGREITRQFGLRYEDLENSNHLDLISKKLRKEISAMFAEGLSGEVFRDLRMHLHKQNPKGGLK